MKRVYKYTLNYYDPSLLLPKGYEILNVGAQDEDIMIWALIDPKEPTEQVDFDIYGTGWDIEEDYLYKDYVGTVHLQEAGLVYHIFKKGA